MVVADGSSEMFLTRVVLTGAVSSAKNESASEVSSSSVGVISDSGEMRRETEKGNKEKQDECCCCCCG